MKAEEIIMELHDLIYSRQSVRKFKDTPVPDEDVLKILDAVRVGPSSENEQNWHFIVVRNEEFKRKLGEVITAGQQKISAEVAVSDEKQAKRFEKFTKLFTLFALKAPVLVMVYSFSALPAAYREYNIIKRPQEDIDELFLQSPAMMGLGAALEHAVLTMMEGVWYDDDDMSELGTKDIEKLVEEEIGFQREGWFLAAMMPIGVPDGELKSPGRKNMEEIVTFHN